MTTSSSDQQPTAADVSNPFVDRAARLFEYLTRVQQLTSTPVRHVESYKRDEGSVLWLDDMPAHEAIQVATFGADPSPDDPLLVLDRIPRYDSPELPGELEPWVRGRLDDPKTEPELKDRAVLAPDETENGDVDSERPAKVLRLEDHPDIRALFLEWFDAWDAWAAHERESQPARDVYNEVFRVYIAHRNAPEEWEAVLGVAALSWQPDEHEQVLRHCFTHEVDIDFDDDTGRLTVHQSPDASLVLELGMLDIDRWPDQPRLQEVRAAAGNYVHSVLSRDHVGELARPLTHNLSADGRYVDEDAPQAPTGTAVTAFAPAFIFRKRTRQGLIEIFQTIKAQLLERGDVPAGIKVLLDPGQAPSVTEVVDHREGAWVEDGDDVYLPLPVNDRQLEVVRRVDRQAMTLVQGPPGTGKTHTAATLISHLLAQGKRVLVTAQTDRALKELRSQLPADIRDLSVSIVGAGRDELSELRVAVKKLSQMASEHDDTVAQEQLDRIQSDVDRLKQQKSQLGRQLLEARESETRIHRHAGYEGTLAKIAGEHSRDSEQLGWLAQLIDVDADAPCPLKNSEALELLELLRDGDIRADEREARRDLLDPEQLLTPEEFADLVAEASAAAAADRQQDELRGHDAYEQIADLDEDDRRALRERVDQLSVRAEELGRRNEQWLSSALADVRSGRLQPWRSRHEQVNDLASRAGPLIDELGPLVSVRLGTSDPLPLVPHAEAVREYLESGKDIKTDSSTGMPKQGLLTARVIKDAQPLFENVRVDGLPPTTARQLDTFITWAEVSRCLDALDRAWPKEVEVPEEDSLAERLAWHLAELAILDDVMQLGRDLAVEDQRLDELDVKRPDWNDLDGVRRFARLVDAVDSAENLEAAEEPLIETAELTADAARWDDAAEVVHELDRAASHRDTTQYRSGYRRLMHLLDVRTRADRRDALLARLRPEAAAVARTLQDSSDDGDWTGRCREFEEAWAWASTATWIRERSTVDINGLLDSYNGVEDRLREQISEFAAVRAWSKAVERLDRQARADLMQYAQLVQAFGKTGGKYRERRLSNMRETMQRCRPSVPVWIMPLYRIAQSMQVDADLFDVVIVDEASQAGLEATFLQYLAPKIVVIGDDKQVSPRAVGVDQSQLQGLANQLLYDDRYKASWEHPKRSLFDEARMRFGDLITLIEHRRCVPEIIGFSNRIAYEPDDIRLIPVRQIGSDALEPIKPVYVPNGYNRGDRNKTNPAEVDAIVDQIEKCLADERYDGMSFGVISLTGAYQAKALEKALMDRLDPREWEARDLRCGTAPDFQGSERDIMFLSMVAVLEEDRRYAPLTANMYVQQFNVAASRAKDQMWVFHSIRPEELNNHEDMRYQLLDYCYGVTRRRSADGEHSASPVPEDRLVPPFDSIFEQRVHNRIFDRGHIVIPQYEVEPWRIDLVVVGAQGRLAVECDGDEWHGPDRFEHDIARQRELQRCGWRFFRVRESEFNIDAARAMAPLWDLLDEFEIHPSSRQEPETTEAIADAEEMAEEPEPISSATQERAAEPSSARKAPTLSLGLDELDRQPRLLAETEDPASPHSAESRPPSLSEEAATDQGHEADAPGSDGTASRSEPAAGDAEPVATSDESGPLSDLAAVYATPQAYRRWDISTTLPDPHDARPEERRDALRRIVEVEGPIVGDRLYQLYVKSAGGSRVSAALASKLNKATSRMEREGVLLSDDPLDEGGQKSKTFRLPTQPPILVRELGGRTIHEVPPLELAARLRALRRPEDSQEEAFRRILDGYGLIRLTTATRERLQEIATLLEGLD